MDISTTSAPSRLALSVKGEKSYTNVEELVKVETKQGHKRNLKSLTATTIINKHNPSSSQTNINSHTKDLFNSVPVTQCDIPSF